MNLERIRALADHLETIPDKFDIRSVFRDAEGEAIIGYDRKFKPWIHLHECGAAACMAGHTVALFEPDKKISSGGAYHRACDLLGGDGRKWFPDAELFSPHNCGWDAEAITAQVCAQVLRILADTGEVRWDLVLDQDQHNSWIKHYGVRLRDTRYIAPMPFSTKDGVRDVVALRYWFDVWRNVVELTYRDAQGAEHTIDTKRLKTWKVAA